MRKIKTGSQKIKSGTVKTTVPHNFKIALENHQEGKNE